MRPFSVPATSCRLVSRSASIWAGLVIVLTLFSSWFHFIVPLSAGQDAPVPLAERARGAERVIVGRVTSVSPMWRVNDFGDRLIVSIVHVAVVETLKGQARTTADVEIEGGTIGTLTLHVSDEESFKPGDRAVFYLTQSARGGLVPHLRGQGLLRLDRSNRVPGSSLTLDEIRRTVAAAPR